MTEFDIAGIKFELIETSEQQARRLRAEKEECRDEAMKACSFDDEKSCAGRDCSACSINPNAPDWREFHKYTDAIHARAEDTRKGGAVMNPQHKIIHFTKSLQKLRDEICGAFEDRNKRNIAPPQNQTLRDEIYGAVPNHTINQELNNLCGGAV